MFMGRNVEIWKLFVFISNWCLSLSVFIFQTSFFRFTTTDSFNIALFTMRSTARAPPTQVQGEAEYYSSTEQRKTTICCSSFWKRFKSLCTEKRNKNSHTEKQHYSKKHFDRRMTRNEGTERKKFLVENTDMRYCCRCRRCCCYSNVKLQCLLCSLSIFLLSFVRSLCLCILKINIRILYFVFSAQHCAQKFLCRCFLGLVLGTTYYATR